MESSKQVQKAGDNSQQLQVKKIVYNNGISEERTRAIFSEMFSLVCQNYTKEAVEIAQSRIDKFEESLIPRLAKIERAFEAFADPKFQFLLKNAQKTAASTERENDYNLLTELLVCHIQKGDNRKTRASIGLAIGIVDDIDNDALCALTVAHAVILFRPTLSSCRKGLEILNELYSKLLYQELPTDKDWFDHLDILGAIRVVPFGNMSKIPDMYQNDLNGYVCIGIKKYSDEYSQAIKKLIDIRLNPEILVDNEMLDGYVRLSVRNKDYISELTIENNNVIRKINEHEIDCLTEIYGLYSKDVSLQEKVNRKFTELWNSFEYLNRLGKWWNSINVAFSITPVGRTLAHTNAKRCDPSLPDLI